MTVALALEMTLGDTAFASNWTAREGPHCVDEKQPSPLMAAYLMRRDALVRFLTARTGNREEAEDLLQELFLKVGRFASPEDVRDPGAYLYRMAANLARDRRRDQMRARAREGHWVQTSHVLIGKQAIDDTPSAEAAHAAKQRLQAIRSSVEKLPPQCRRVFELHKFEGLSHDQVARQLGISRSSVEKHMHTALRRLIADLGDE